MHLSPDVIRQISRERQEQLRAEAAAFRLAGSVPARTRLAAALRRVADRFDAPVASGPSRSTLTERA